MRTCVIEAMQAEATEDNEWRTELLWGLRVLDHGLTAIASGKHYDFGRKTLRQTLEGNRSNVGIFDQDAINAAFG